MKKPLKLNGLRTFMSLVKPQTAAYWASRSRFDKGDWGEDPNIAVDWINGYLKSRLHPHRQLIVDAVASLKADSVLEIGCSCGPNLVRLSDKFPDMKLGGIDVNADSIAFGKGVLPQAALHVGNFKHLPWANSVFDVIIADAVLMYCDPDEIHDVFAEMDRVAAKGIIIIDRFDRSIKGKPHAGGHIWARDYGAWLKRFGYKVKKRRITKKDWPTSKNWQLFGKIWIGTK